MTPALADVDCQVLYQVRIFATTLSEGCVCVYAFVHDVYTRTAIEATCSYKPFVYKVREKACLQFCIIHVYQHCWCHLAFVIFRVHHCYHIMDTKCYGPARAAAVPGAG